MEALAYLATFVSLILGLAVANVLSRISRMVKRGPEADWYFLHTLWAVFVLFLMASEWWIILKWAKVGTIGFWVYLFLLAKPCVLFIASDVLFPDEMSGAQLNLKTYFWSVRRRFFCLLALYPALDVVDTLLKGWDHVRDLGPTYAVGMSAGFLTLLIGAWSDDERVQLGVVVSFFVGVSLMIMNALKAV